MNTKYLTGILCLALGCAAGAAMDDVVVPIAGAQASGKQFQAHCEELKWEDVLGKQELKPDLGQQGWELATFVAAEMKGGFGTTTRIVACWRREVG